MSAPSFSSFPPSFASFPELDSGRQTPNEPSGSHNDKRREKRGHKADKKSKHDKHHRPKKHTEDGGKRQALGVPLEPGQGSSKRVYYSDPKGDPLNVLYGGLHAGDVPRHHLVGRGKKVLGLSSAWTASHRSRNGVEIGPRERIKTASLTDSKARALLALPPKRRIVNPAETRRYEEIDGFIRLPTRKGNEDPESSYRSIDVGPNDHTDSSSSESEGADDASSDTDDSATELTSLQVSIKSLERELSADPTSITNWLALLSHTLSTIPITSKNATKARSEITLSLLGRALAADSQNAGSTRLRIKYLKAGEEVWHESKVRAEWEGALKLGRPSLWMEWLEWRIRKGSNGITGILDDARRVLTALGDLELAKIRVFWRIAVELRNAGFTERAMAMFQAQSELTFEVPQDLYGLPLPHLLNSLEEFWESETPRIGEIGAKGWSSWFTSKKVEQTRNSEPSSALGLNLNISDPYLRWSLLELHSDRHSRLPSRSYDAVSESDPYTTILFADVRDMLMDLKTSRAKDAFRFSWLSFLGLHIPGFLNTLVSEDGMESWDDRWAYTHLPAPVLLNSIFPSPSEQKTVLADAVAGVIVGRSKEYTPVFGPVKAWGYGVLRPLDVGLVFPKQSLWSKQELEDTDILLVRRVFEQLRLSTTDHEWDELALTFEHILNAKTAMKLSRVILSKAQDSLPHWSFHAKLERLRGKLDEARKIYHAVLIASSTSADSPFAHGRLWWDWAEMEWLAGKDVEALHVLMKVAGVEGEGGLATLRAKRSLEDIVNTRHHVEAWKDREAWIQLQALLVLLVGGGLSAALEIFDRYKADVDIDDVARESLTVASILMTYRYGVVLRNPMPPVLLRDRATSALESYGSNSLVLAMFLEAEKGQGVWGRVRSILGDEAAGNGHWKEKDVARRVEEVWIAGWEKGRWLGEVERTRKGLAGATESERTRASYVIWRVYLEFEIRVGQLERAKKLLYRAIGDCPLAKELYLLAFGPLRKVYTPSELNAFADTMAERGLRLRSGLDEALSGWKGGDSDEESHGSEMDEIEQNAEEYRRLRPY
ncbi:NRDE2 family protein [Pleurotus pulmonarius]